MAKKKDKKNKLAIIIAVGKPKGMAYGGMASGKDIYMLHQELL